MRNKKGQVTIFIIVAIIIIVLGILIYFFYPKISSTLGFGTVTPSSYLQDCLKDKITTTAKELSLQGGSLNPEHYYLYEDNKIEYLCYSELPYLQCVMQQPMLKDHIENEIKTAIENDANNCLNNMEKSFNARGYNVILKKEVLGLNYYRKKF